LDDRQLNDNLFLFFLAGHETSATALTWALYEMAKNPEVQKKAREEVITIVGKNKTPSWDDLNKLEYIHMILKETLRLWDPVIAISRSTDKQVTIGNYKIPKDTLVMLSLYSIHHHPDIWPEPYKFDPERFTQDNSQNRHPYAWLPFSAGPRSCLGNKFSLLEMKLTLALILQKFQFELDPTYKLEIDRNITIRPKESLRLIFSHL